MAQQTRKWIRILAAAAALVLCLGGVAAVAPAHNFAAAEEQEIVSSYPYTTVTKVKVNLRKSRSVKSELIHRIPAGAEITVKEKNGNWVAVQYGKYKGWVRGEYIVLKTVKKIRVTPTPTPIPTLSPEEDAGGYTILRRGDKSKAVRSLQEALIELGYMSKKATADGIFGEATEKAVIAFQQKNQYPDTGLVDANLQAYLYSGKPLNSKGNRQTVKTLSPVPGATMKMNNTGALVGELQQMLADLGYYTAKITNVYDTPTRSAVTAFQKKNGLKADGAAGAETRKLLESGSALGVGDEATPTPEPTPTPTPVPTFEIPGSTVKNGSEGKDAKAVQERLQELGYYRGKLDGKFGRASVNALKSFQTNNGLKADGIAGKGTYSKLFSIEAVSFQVPDAENPGEIPEATTIPESAAAKSSVWTTLRRGSTGTDVKQLQENLIQLGYLNGKPDGNYGLVTAAAVKAFQIANGLKADGAAGEQTLKKLYGGDAKEAVKKSAAAEATPAPGSTGSLKRGSTGTEVKSLQTLLIEQGYLSGRADGVYGSKTAAAVRAFQKANQLTADGIAGAKTLAKLEGGSLPAATPTPTPTPTPAPVPGAAEALAGRPNASRVIYANWYTTVKDVAKKYPYATVYDYATGISWQVNIFSVGAHADCEPVTANDTAKMNRAFGGETTWNPKAVWVIFSDGSVYMASIHNTPHGTSHNKDNNFNGHLCIHFPRTQAQVTAIGPYATSHQETIDQGWAETRKMTY